MWAWWAIGIALAQEGGGAYPDCDPTQPELPCDLDPYWSPSEADLPDPDVAAGAEPAPEVLPEPSRILVSYAYMEPGVVAGYRPASPLRVAWEEALPFRPVVMPDALGDSEIPNPLRPQDWAGTPSVRVTVPIPGAETDAGREEDFLGLEGEDDLVIERESEIGSD